MVAFGGGEKSPVCASQLARSVIDVERMSEEDDDDDGGDTRFGDVIDEVISIQQEWQWCTASIASGFQSNVTNWCQREVQRTGLCHGPVPLQAKGRRLDDSVPRVIALAIDTSAPMPAIRNHITAPE